MIRENCYVVMAGKPRLFEKVEYTQLRSRWIVGIEEHARLSGILAEQLLSSPEPFTLTEIRFFIARLRLNTDMLGEALGLSPEEWDRCRNDDPTPERSAIWRQWLRTKMT